MSINRYSFHQVDPCLKSFRLLHDFEHQRVLFDLNISNIKLYSIPVDNWICVVLGAKENDIICIKDHIANIYRRVIAKSNS